MKKLISLLIAFAFASTSAFAAVAVKDQGTYEGEAVSLNLGAGLSGSNDGSTYTVIAKNPTVVVITAGATPTLTVPVGVDFVATDTITTDNQDQTITFSSGGTIGQRCSIVFQTDSGGSGDEVITFQTTLVNSAGTLTLANLTAGRYTVNFQSDGTVWNEVSRTAALS